MSKQRDYYKILGIPRTASKAEVKKAYRDKARAFHPDKQLTEDDRSKSEKRMIEINQAYEIVYDDGTSQTGSGDWSDLLRVAAAVRQRGRPK